MASDTMAYGPIARHAAFRAGVRRSFRQASAKAIAGKERPNTQRDVGTGYSGWHMYLLKYASRVGRM